MSRKISVCGICTALCVLCLYLASVITTNTIFFIGFSTLFIAVAVVECGTFYALLVYVSSSLLGFLIIPDKILMLPFAVFFGAYAIVKRYIERINILAVEWLVKTALFCIALFFMLKMFLPETKLPTAVIAAAAIIVFAVYDMALSAGITFYKKRFKNMSKNS